MVLPSLFSFSKHGIVDDKSSEQFVDTMRKRLNIKSPGRLPVAHYQVVINKRSY